METNKYNYNGSLEPVHVKVITFYGMPDYILSFEQWNSSGGWKGLIKIGEVQLREVTKVLTGTMNPIEFANLEAWEG